jgi:hypothetical protein
MRKSLLLAVEGSVFLTVIPIAERRSSGDVPRITNGVLHTSKYAKVSGARLVLSRLAVQVHADL